MSNWHTKSKEEIFRELKTSEKGLSSREFEKRVNEFGLNQFLEKKKKNPLFDFLKQFQSPLIYILFVAMAISFIFDHLIDAYVILAVVLINATIGFIQERKAEMSINALKKMIISYAKVYRDGKLTKIPSSHLVPGDIIFLEDGDKVPADARLIEIHNFRTQESSLTGESFPQDKEINSLNGKVPISDRTNMIFMGTIIVSGTAIAIIVETGDKTELGKVAQSIQEVIQPKMHFKEKVDELAIQMAIFASIGALITFVVGYFLDSLNFFDIFLFTIASLVSGIPEGLPAVLVIVLAIGARRMAKRNAVIRHLPAVETLGVATIIATDKTGTLTQNSMVVEKIITHNQSFSITGNGWQPLGKFFLDKNPLNPKKIPELNKILSISAMSNKGNLLRKNGDYEILGDPTEVALLVLSKKAGIDKASLNEELVDDLPFNPELKFRASLIKEKKSNKNQIYSIGAFETILERSSYFLNENKKTKLDNKIRDYFLEQAKDNAKKGMRILGIAYKDVPTYIKSVSEDSVSNMVFVGLTAMKDPPRKDVKDAIKKAQKAGIRIILKTGDYKETAEAIAREIGLIHKNEKILTEEDLEGLSDIEFKKIVKEVNIFARVTPNMKMKIVKALQEQGEIVAMTGDGVNDAPALKRADIGIAMGVIGTDVARESSEMVLADDNFSSIVNAIEEGRIVFQNVRQTSFYLITTNVAEDVTIISSLIMGLPLPMLPIQLLYLNLVTDGVNDIALAMEPGHNDVLNLPPRDKKEKIINKELIPFLILMAGLMVVGTIPLFLHYLSHGIEKARTVAFVSMSMFQLWNVLNMRSLRKSLFKIGIFSNKFLAWSLLFSFFAMVAVVYFPFFQDIFQFISLSVNEFLLIILISSSVLVFGEIFKRIKYRQ